MIAHGSRWTRAVRPALLVKAYVYAVATIGVCFAIPAIGLCGVLPRQGIVWSIALLTAAGGAGLVARGWRLRTNAAVSEDSLVFIVAGCLALTASVLWPMLA